MSTHCFISGGQKRGSLVASAFFVLALIVLLLIVINPATALASTVPAPQEPKQDSSFAGVSVVRVVSTYTPRPGTSIKPTEPSLVQCTGLGVIIASWTMADSTEMNNWVLTDGNLVDPAQEACGTTHTSQLTLSTLKIFFSSAYNQTLQSAPVAVSPTAVSTPTIRCQEVACSQGPALLAFPTESTHTLPFVDLATSDLKQTAKIALSQQNSAVGTLALPPSTNQDSKQVDQYTTQLQQFLTPQRVVASDVQSTVEAGTPLVNSAGELVALSVNNKVSPLADLMTWIHTQPELRLPQPVTHVNLVHESWKRAISDYYQGNYTNANLEFQAVTKNNALFQQAPRDFEQLIANHLAQQQDTGNGGNGKPLSISFLGITLSIPNVRDLAIIGFAVLGVLLILVIVLLFRSRTRRQRVFKEYDEAERRAEQEAQRITAMEAAQKPQPSTQPGHTASLSPFSAGAVVPGALMVGDLQCPNCKHPVMRGDNFCSNCRMALLPSESGHHIRLAQQPSAPPDQYSPAPPAQHSPVPVRAFSEQPTIEMSPGVSNEQPTLEIAPAVPMNGQSDVEKTVPYAMAMQQLKGNRLGFAVGTRSDPGIKRRYKPNEDSLFAAQWEQNANVEAVPFGLFVIADGMGGHANGQDASRSAIQTIIDFMLPKLSKSTDLQNQNLEQLLANAVQHANQVVHQHNMELRADMGTTVTAALIVGATAYVTNVGDSRTYLYREPEGLRKVTNDHSVVASLVEAGIIKPDDIYTHPKRNQIYRSLGEKSSVEVDSFVVQLQPGDKLLLCSDGLWDMVRDPKIEGVVKSTIPDPKMTAEALIQAALDGGGEDNVSVIVVSITETPQHNVGHGIQLLAKPDAVQMPQL